MLVYAVVSAATEKPVELFVRREDADAFVDDVRGDDEELAGTLRLGGRARHLANCESQVSAA